MSLRLENAPVSVIVEALHSRGCAAVSFIAAVPEGKVDVEAKEARVPEVLSKIAQRSPGYRAETIAGRNVLYPVAPEFQMVLDQVEIQSKPRQAALEEYVDLLRKRIPALATLTAQWLIGDDRHPIYSDLVSVRQKGRVIEQMVDLLGQDPNLYFEFVEARSGVPMVRFSGVHCAGGARLKGRLAFAMSASAVPSPSVETVNLRLESAPVSAIVAALHSRACAAVSFIAAVPEGEVDVEAKESSVPDVLSTIAQRSPGYRAETIAGRSVCSTRWRPSFRQ